MDTALTISIYKATVIAFRNDLQQQGQSCRATLLKLKEVLFFSASFVIYGSFSRTFLWLTPFTGIYRKCICLSSNCTSLQQLGNGIISLKTLLQLNLLHYPPENSHASVKDSTGFNEENQNKTSPKLRYIFTV